MIYCRENVNKLANKLQEEIGDESEEHILLGGDFNTRIGDEGRMDNGEEEGERRASKDNKRNTEGEHLIRLVENRGWMILNGNVRGDEIGEYTFTGKVGASVIDYGITNLDSLKFIEEFKIEGRTESEHLPLECTMRGKIKRKEEEEEIQEREKISWSKESTNNFRAGMAVQQFSRKGVEDSWKELQEAIHGCLEKKLIKSKKKKIGTKKWWDRECRREKRKVKKLYQEWRDGKGEREAYITSRTQFRKLCREKEERIKEQKIEEIKNLKNGREFWSYINRYRKPRTEIDEGIEMEVWKVHFIELLGGSEKYEISGWSRRADEELEEETTELTIGEIDKQIRRLKERKASGEDKIPNEVWKAKKEMEEIGLRNPKKSVERRRFSRRLEKRNNNAITKKRGCDRCQKL